MQGVQVRTLIKELRSHVKQRKHTHTQRILRAYRLWVLISKSLLMRKINIFQSQSLQISIYKLFPKSPSIHDEKKIQTHFLLPPTKSWQPWRCGSLNLKQGFPWWYKDKEPACQYRRLKIHGFKPWVWKIPWRRKWQPTPVFSPGKFHGQRSLAGCSPWGCKESKKTKGLNNTTINLTQALVKGEGRRGPTNLMQP